MGGEARELFISVAKEGRAGNQVGADPESRKKNAEGVPCRPAPWEIRAPRGSQQMEEDPRARISVSSCCLLAASIPWLFRLQGNAIPGCCLR